MKIAVIIFLCTLIIRSKKLFNNSYSIKGNFTYTYYINGTGGIKYEDFGTFTIKSDF